MELITKTSANANVPRMLTIREVSKTGVLTENALRAGVKAGWVPHIRTGNRILVNFDKLLNVLEDC